MRLLPDWIEAFLEYSDNSEPPYTYKLWTAITTIAAVLKRKCVLHWGPLKFYPNMYVVLVGPSGECRKGTAMAYGKNLLVRAEVKMSAESITREALVREIKKAYDSEIGPDGTIKNHSSYTIFSPELTVFLGYQNQQLMMDMTDWYDCGHGPEGKWTYRTKHEGTDEIIGVWVNLFGATTPELISSTLSLDAIGGGLTSRMIFVYEEKKGKLCPAPHLTPEEEKIGENLYLDLEKIHLLEGEFQLTKDFTDYWVDWYIHQDAHPPFEDKRFKPYFTRRPTHVMKLSMIVNASRSDEMLINVQDLTRAIEILELTEKKMVNTFSGVGKSPLAELIANVMTEIGTEGVVYLDELQNKFYFDADQWTLGKALDTLQDMRFCEVTQVKGRTKIKHIKREEKHD